MPHRDTEWAVHNRRCASIGTNRAMRINRISRLWETRAAMVADGWLSIQFSEFTLGKYSV